MSKDTFFCHLDSSSMVEFIHSAQRAVVYAGPGISSLAAKAMVDVSLLLGVEMLTVNLDVDEHVIRMGYGDFEAIKLLQNADITINHSPHLRSALLLVDNKGYSFTPTALYLEAENNDPKAYNAIRLTSNQVKEALARLSPVAKSIAIAQAQTQEEKQRLKELPIDVGSKPVDQKQCDKVATSLLEVPPVKFDVARQVRVYESYLQYVEMSLSGAAIQRHRLTIPHTLQKVGQSSSELEGRLRTTFDLIEKGGPLSSKLLEDQLNEIRKNFTPSLGKDHGRVLLKGAKSLFENRVVEFRKKVKVHAASVKEKLQEQLDSSKEAVTLYYLPIVKKSPPDEFLGGLLFDRDPSDEDYKSWINRELDKSFPSAERLINTIKLEVRYKDVTFETLNQNDFLKAIKKAFPHVDWDKAHKEFTAAAQE